MKSNDTAMPIKINGTNIDLGEALPHQVREKVQDVANTYFGRLNHGAVGFTRDGQTYNCTINLHVRNLKAIIAEASAGDCHRAFDQAIGKVDKQLRRRKDRMTDSRQRHVSA
jgi:ribosomal subunit interface protein